MIRDMASAEGHAVDVRLSVLGPLELLVGGHSVEITGMARTILALLGRTPGQVVSVSAIASGVWGERLPSRPEKAVASYVSRLRKAVAAGGTGVDLGSLVVHRAPGYVLTLDPSAVDSEVIERLVGEAGRAFSVGQPRLAAAKLRSALALWRGDAYTEFGTYPFGVAEASRLGELRLTAIEARVEADLAVAAPHAPATIVAELQALVAEHPLRERLRAQLVTALYRLGRQSEALAEYHRARSCLIDELGIEPGPELRAVERAVLANDPVLNQGLVAPTAVPAPLSMATPACVGRDEELAWLAAALDAAALEHGQARLVVGRAGMGKTRLLAEFAQRAAVRGVAVRYGRGASSLDALAADAGRLSLVVVDDLDRATTDARRRVVAWIVASHERPILTVVTTADPEAVRDLGDLARLDLAPLGETHVAQVVRLYVPASTDATALAVVADARGVPALVHDAASTWASAQAGRRVGRAVAEAAEPRRRLDTVRDEITAGVTELVNAHAQTRAVKASREQPVLCPYKGLAFFERSDADLFHGREHLVAAMVARMVGAPMIAVVGASGSGKSSLVRAGLMPALAAGALPALGSARQVVVTPAGVPDLGIVLGAVPDTRVVLAVDQFEEVFTALTAPDRDAFLARLMRCATSGEATVVLALRSDFYGHCAEHPALASMIEANTVLMRPMNVSELRRAIEQPALLAGLSLEDGLVDLLADEVRDAPGGLPLLSTALLSLWERRDGSELTLAAYRENGGVAGAVEQLGERAYAAFESDEERDAARQILLRMAESGGEHGVVRRRATRAELEAVGGSVFERVLQILSQGRLVTAGDDVVEVAHEALLTRWSRLKQWLDEDAVGRALRSHLTPAATAWLAADRDASELYRGARLSAAVEWAGANPGSVTPAEQEFLDVSQEVARADERRRRHNVRRLRQLLAAASVALVVAVAGGVVAVTQQRRADAAGVRADAASVLADARRLGAQALVEPDLRKAALLAVAATRLDDSWQTTGNLLATLQRSPRLVGIAGVSGGERLQGLAVSPDGKTVAVSSNNRRVQIYDAASLRLLANIEVQGIQPVNNLDFTPDGRYLLGLGYFDAPDGHGLQLWDASDGSTVGERFGPPAFERGHNLGGGVLADGDSVVTVDEDGSVARYSLRTGARLRTLLAPTNVGTPSRAGLTIAGDRRTVVVDTSGGAVVLDAFSGVRSDYPQIIGALAISPDGRTLLAAADTGDIGVWDLVSGQRRGVARHHTGLVNSIIWAPDGHTFASTGEDRATVVWDAARLATVEVLIGPAGSQLAVRYSPDGRTLFTEGLDGGLYAWDLSGERGLETEPDPPGYFAGEQNADNNPHVAFDFPRGRAVVCEYDKAYVVDLTTGKPVGPPITLGGSDYRWPTISADGRRMAVGFSEGRGRVWDLESGGLLLDVGELSVDYDAVFTVLSPDGRLVAFAGDQAVGDGQASAVIRFYNVESRMQIHEPWTIKGVGSAAMGISPDGRYLAIALEGWIAIWDLQERRQAAMMANDRSNFAVGFSPDGRYLGTENRDGRPDLWRVGTWERVWAADVGHNGNGLRVSFSPDGRLLASAGLDSKIYLYDAATGTPVAGPLGPGSYRGVQAEFLPDRNEIVGYFKNGALHRWDLDPKSLISRACAIAGRDMTPEEWRRVLPDHPYQHVCPGRQ